MFNRDLEPAPNDDEFVSRFAVGSLSCYAYLSRPTKVSSFKSEENYACKLYFGFVICSFVSFVERSVQTNVPKYVITQWSQEMLVLSELPSIDTAHSCMFFQVEIGGESYYWGFFPTLWVLFLI